METDGVVGSWVETTGVLGAARQEEAARVRRIGELEEVVDLAEAEGDLVAAEAAQVELIELCTRSGGSYDSLGREYARLRELVAAQYDGLSRPPVVRARRPRVLAPAVRSATLHQRAGRWDEARAQLVQHLARTPDDALALANRMICALHLGDGARERLTAQRLLAELPALRPTLELLGLLCGAAAGDRETGRRHALHLAHDLLRGTDVPGLPSALLPDGPVEQRGVDSVVRALDDLVERSVAGDEKLHLEVLRAAYRARGRERAA